jgi:putative endopeptidase
MTDASRSGLALDELSADIRPQDDLFRHVNGAWISRTEIPEDKARWGSFHLIAEQAEKDVHAIVEESQQAEPGEERDRRGRLWNGCLGGINDQVIKDQRTFARCLPKGIRRDAEK